MRTAPVSEGRLAAARGESVSPFPQCRNLSCRALELVGLRRHNRCAFLTEINEISGDVHGEWCWTTSRVQSLYRKGRNGLSVGMTIANMFTHLKPPCLGTVTH